MWSFHRHQIVQTLCEGWGGGGGGGGGGGAEVNVGQSILVTDVSRQICAQGRRENKRSTALRKHQNKPLAV